MKCDDVYTSEEEDDEEIIHLKEALEKKRLEKKHERQQAAFSDGTTQSTSSDPSMGTESPSEQRNTSLSYYLNNRVFLSRNYRLIVAPRNLMFLSLKGKITEI